MKPVAINLDGYQPLPVAYELRHAILEKVKKGEDALPDIQGRDEVKKDVLRALLSGAHPYLVSEEGTGKTRLARSLTKLLPPTPIIKGCPYNDNPKWPSDRMCPRCAASEDPVKEFGVEVIPGERRFSRIQGNEYTNEAKLLGLKDIQAIVRGKSPSDPQAFTGTGVFRANRGILFIDELPAIRVKVQVLLHPILEERKAILEEYNWEHYLDLVVIATGNPEAFSHVNEIPRPLLDRLELVYMDLPGQAIEKHIMLKEKFQPKKDALPPVEAGEILPSPSLKELERTVVVPWWIMHLVSGAVRQSRICGWLDKKASIRGSTRALDHTYASAELDNRKVATLADAYLGLRLALRGRIGLRADLIDFDNPKASLMKTERVIEDLLWNALEDVSFDFGGDQDKLRGDLIALFSDGLVSAVERLDAYPMLNQLVKRMMRVARDEVTDDLNDAEKAIFLHPEKASRKVFKEYARSALEVIVNLAWHRQLVDDSIRDRVFIPRIIKQGDL